MPNAARKLRLSTAVQDTIGNPAFIDCLDQAVTEAASRTFAVGQPTYLPGCVGQYLYFYGVDSAYQALRSHGYTVTRETMQLRLHAHNSYECPVWLRFGFGNRVGNNLIFNWPRGVATAVGVRQNQKRLGVQYQPSLFSLDTAGEDFVEPDLNLWVVYHVGEDHLRAFLGLGIEFVSRSTIYCERIAEICNKPLEIAQGADLFIGSTDSDIDVEFGEKPTGT